MSISGGQVRLPCKMAGVGQLSLVSVLAVASLTLVLALLMGRLVRRSREAAPAAGQGERRVGSYVLLDKIGEGATGEVFRARHARLGRVAAIKLLSSGASASERSRFEREAELTATIGRAAAAAVYDIGESEDGRLYYVMELVDGVTLTDLVERGGVQTPERVERIVAQVAAALRVTHEAGFVHRDVKPDNIVLLVRDGGDAVRLLDFGLAAAIGREDGPDASDVVVGTPRYLAPEAVLAPADVSPERDVYALGALAYYLLTGRPPFTGESVVEIISRQLYSEPLPPSQIVDRAIPKALERVVLDCLAKDPIARPSSAAVERRLGRQEAEDEVVGALGWCRARRPFGLRFAAQAALVTASLAGTTG